MHFIFMVVEHFARIPVLALVGYHVAYIWAMIIWGGPILADGMGMLYTYDLS